VRSRTSGSRTPSCHHDYFVNELRRAAVHRTPGPFPSSNHILNKYRPPTWINLIAARKMSMQYIKNRAVGLGLELGSREPFDVRNLISSPELDNGTGQEHEQEKKTDHKWTKNESSRSRTPSCHHKYFVNEVRKAAVHHTPGPFLSFACLLKYIS
jgi:hypothetical protein